MELKEMLKWGVLMVVSGVVTAVAIQLVTKQLEDKAILAARAELERLMVAAASQRTQQEVVTQNPSNAPNTHIML